jgi:hypothetical protein
MKQRSKRGITFGLFVMAPLSALACSAASGGRVDPGVADASAAIREDTDEIPCAPRVVLETICQRCHALRPRGGAPFPLVRRSDVVARVYQGSIVRELMIAELEAGRMPLRPVTIEPEPREALLGWLRAGAPAVSARSCTDAGAGMPTAAATDAAPSATTSPLDSSAEYTPPDTGSDAGTDPDADADAGPGAGADAS